MTLSPAYLAGFLDSDGCISVATKNEINYSVSIAFRQVRPEALLILHEIYGGSLFKVTPSLSHPKDRRQLGLGLATETSIKLLTQITPHLRIKKAQAEAVLNVFGDRLQLYADTALPLIQFLTQEKAKTIDVETFPWAGSEPQTFPFEELPVFYCTESGCRKVAKARMLCQTHYRRCHAKGNLPTVSQPHRKRIPEPFDYLRAPTQDEIGYLAGNFDGDGNFEADYAKVSARVQQSTGEAVLLAKEIYGGGLYLAQREDEDGNAYKPVVVWHINRQNQVLTFIRDVQPYLLEKKFEANLLINWRSRMPREHYTQLMTPIRKRRKEELSLEQFEEWKADGVIGKVKQTCRASLDGQVCGKRRIAGDGLCAKHYERQKLNGDPLLVNKQISRRVFALVRAL